MPSNLLCSGMWYRDRSLHASAIQGHGFHVTPLGPDNITLQKWQSLRNTLEQRCVLLLKVLTLLVILEISFISQKRAPKSEIQNLAIGGKSSCIPPSPGNEPGAQQWDECVTFATAGSGNLRNCSFIKHIRDSALFAYWYPWRKGIQRWGCECYLLYHHFQAARTVLFALK